MDNDFPNLDQTPQQNLATHSAELWHREQRRRSNDIIRVYNPTDQDFFIQWDYLNYRFPAKGTADVLRYIATKYCRDMKDKLINEENERKHDAELEDRRKKKIPDFKDKYEENHETYMKQNYKLTTDRAESEKIYDQLWVGVVYENGKDVPPRTDPRSGEVDQTSVDERLFKNLDKKRVTDMPDIQSTEKPFTKAVTAPEDE